MLSPNARSVYTDALTPPPGLVFDEGIAATFSLDPLVLLSVPVHLAFMGHGADQLLDSLTALEAIRRLAGRITAYADLGRLQVPRRPHPLYGLLEPMIVEVEAPRGGAFHPKFWVLRFIDPEGDEPPLLRLMILSRNLTSDRSWDLALTLEGIPTRRYRAQNSALGRLIEALPTYAKHEIAPARATQAHRLAREVWCTPWYLPPGFSSVSFHVNGQRRKSWKPHDSRRMVIVSPFCSSEALGWLTSSTDKPEALISRPEELAELPMETRDLFADCRTLDEAAEANDGESTDEPGFQDAQGLHAKAFVYERGWDTHLIVGSANATNAALMKPVNIELLAELVGRRSQVGDIDQLLGPDGVGGVLVEYRPEDEPLVQPEHAAAEKALEDARRQIARSELRLRFASDSQAGFWVPELVGASVAPKDISSVRCWLITTQQEGAVDAQPLFDQGLVHLQPCSTESTTGLLAFEIRAQASDKTLLFALNLPVEGLPEEREGAIFRLVLENREAFLRYLLLLLGDIDAGAAPQNGYGWEFGSWGKGTANKGLMEELVRAYCRDPELLESIREIIQRLQNSEDGSKVIPPEFLRVWEVFLSAMGGNHV